MYTTYMITIQFGMYLSYFLYMYIKNVEMEKK